MSLLTDEQEQALKFFPTRFRNEEPSSRSISPEPTSSIADASAAATQKKKQYETLKRANNSIDVLGITPKIRLLLHSATSFNKKFGSKIC